VFDEMLIKLQQMVHCNLYPQRKVAPKTFGLNPALTSSSQSQSAIKHAVFSI